VAAVVNAVGAWSGAEIDRLEVGDNDKGATDVLFIEVFVEVSVEVFIEVVVFTVGLRSR
jgi:hypothetical protein